MRVSFGSAMKTFVWRLPKAARRKSGEVNWPLRVGTADWVGPLSDEVMVSTPGARGQGVLLFSAAVVRRAHGPLGVQDQQQPVVELVRPADQFPGRPLERLGQPLEQLLGHPEDVPDLVHQQADRPV